jgi:hypothetical protein
MDNLATVGARDARLMAKNCGHNDIPVGPCFWDELLGFLHERRAVGVQ